MSLKAKLEAVIYAAEEPVTLGQLAALFATDALELKAEKEAVSATVAAESADQPTEAVVPLPLLNAEFVYREPDQGLTISASPEPPTASGESSAKPAQELGQASNPAPSEEASPEPEDASATAESSASAELEARRQARLRDREARAVIRQLLDELIASYASDGCGIEIREIAGGFRMATKPEYHDAVRSFVKSLKPPLRLSLPALETLAVIAYKQPVTAPEVNEIRGVESSGVLGTLLARKLIATSGRKQVIGRPILYKTTREFLLRFGLKDVTELPSMEEFEKMAAIELDEPEFSGEEEPAPETSTDLSLELDETEEAEPAIQAAPALAEAAPAEPSPTEQAETENLPRE